MHQAVEVLLSNNRFNYKLWLLFLYVHFAHQAHKARFCKNGFFSNPNYYFGSWLWSSFSSIQENKYL